jgi:hypothetical protein
MARQMGPIPLTGTIDGLTFYYHPEDGYLAKQKSSLTAERVMNDPKFKQFVYSSMEFGEAIFAGKLLRKSIRNILFPAADGKLSSRMNTTMLSIVQSDVENDFGMRKFEKGDATVLKDFEFNVKQAVHDAFSGNYLISRNKANDDLYISIPAFEISSKITAPEYASHFQFVAARTSIDFKHGTYKSIYGETASIPLNQSLSEDLRFILPSNNIPGGLGLMVLGIVFFAELKKIPRGAISQRKRQKLKGMVGSDGMVKFMGVLKVVRAGRDK